MKKNAENNYINYVGASPATAQLGWNNPEVITLILLTGLRLSSLSVQQMNVT